MERQNVPELLTSDKFVSLQFWNGAFTLAEAAVSLEGENPAEHAAAAKRNES